MVHKAVVRLAAWRRRQEGLDAIRGAMEDLEQAMIAEDGPAMVLANERFHDSIGQAARPGTGSRVPVTAGPTLRR